jgi:hypothetical protein
MPDVWYFQLEHRKITGWIWRRVTDDGRVLDESGPFSYYLQALRHARARGLSGIPHLGAPPVNPES